MQDIRKADSVARSHSSDKSRNVPAWSRVLRGGRMTKWKGAVASFAPNVAEIVTSSASRALPLLLATGLTVGSAGAADRYWDSNATTPGYGGAGTWDLTAQTWSPSNDGVSGPYTAWSNSAFDDAIFGGTAGTVALGSSITAGGLTFNIGGYTLSGGVLTLGGVTPTITTSGTITINSVIAGSSGLIKAGGGTLVLNGINTFTGRIDLNAGTINAGSDSALGAVGNDIFTAAGASVTVSIAGANTNRTINIGDGGTLTVAGSGAGSALVTGNGRVSVGRSVTMSNDANTYTGQTVFHGVNGVATSWFTSIGNLGEASSLGAPTTVSDGTIIFNQSSQYRDQVVYLGDGDSSNRNWELNGQAANIRNQGTGTLSITGDILTTGGSGFYADDADIELLGVLSGVNYTFTGSAGRTITLGGTNTYTGKTGIANITVRATALTDAGAASSFGAGSDTIAITSNGTLSYTGTGGSSNRQWTIGSGSILNDGSGALTLSGAVDLGTAASDSLTLGGSFAGINTLSGVISGTGDLISEGAGTWVLSGANTRTGAIVIDGGTLRAGNASAFGTITDLTINGGTLDLGGFDLVAPSLEGTGGAIALGANTLTVHTTETTSYAGVIGGTGGLTKAGMGALTLSGANTYTGDTTLGGGTLTLDYSASGAPATNIIAGASTLNIAGGKLDIIGADGAANIQNFNGLNVTAGSNQITASSGDGGSMTVNFGAITRTGGLVDFALPASGSFTTTNTSLGGWATVNGTDYAKVDGVDIVAFTAADYTNKDDAADWLTGEVISDVGGDADTPFFGTVDGTKHLGGLKYTAAAASTVTIGTGETLGVDGTIIVASSVGANDQTITGGSLTGGAGGSTLGILQNGGARFTIGSTIVDNGGATGFTKGGEGIVRLAGTNTYTGVTTLSGGELQIASLADGGSASSIGQASADSSNLVLESGMLHYVGGTDGSTNRGFTLVNGGASAPEIVVEAGRTIEFSGLVTSPDDAGLTKTGWGTLVLSNAANDYVGVTTIRGSGANGSSTISVNTLTDGGVASGIGAAGSDSANLVLSDGGQLQYTGGSVDIDRGFTLASGAGRIGVAQAATTLTVEGTAVGAGRLIKEGAGTLVLTGLNTYTGNTTVNAGTLLAGSAQAFGNETTSMTVNSGATLDLGGFAIKVGALSDGTLGGGSVSLGAATLTIGGTNGTFSGVISGSGGLTHVRDTQVMSGCNNTYSGATTLGGGTLSVDCLADGGEASGIGASSADSANLAFTGGRLTYTGASTSIDRGFTLQSGDGYINVDNAATVLEFEGAVVGGGRLRKEGDGVLLLSGTNTYTGGTIISGGILRSGSNDALGVRGIDFGNVVGAALDLDGFDNTVGFLRGGGALGGDVMLGSATLTLDWSGSADFAGAISGTGGIIKNGSLNQTLSGCDSDYTGSTAINGGVLSVSCLEDGGADSSIGASTADAGNLIINGGTLRYIGTGGSTNRQFTLGASGGNTLDASGTGAIEFTSTAPLTFSGADTAQTLALTGTNKDDNVLAAEITNNGTGETSLTKTGAGTWILTNPDSSYTGKTVISGGVLGVDKLADGGEASSLGASSADAANLVIGNDSTLRYTGSGDTTNRLFTLSAGTTTIQSSGSGAVVFTDTGPVTLAGNNQNRTIALGGTNADDNILAGSIGDAGSGTTILAKNDSGTWVLTGDNTYTGTTVINDGTLKIGGGGATGSIVSDTINLGTLVFDHSDTYTYNGVISNVGNVEQAGSGTTILTGDSTYSGGTTISDGTLQLGNSGASGSILGDVTDDGVLAFDRSDAYTFGGTVSGSGEVSQIGSGKTILTADNTYTGGTTITGGTLQLGSGGASGSIVGDVANDGALIFDHSNYRTFAGLVSGAGTVEQVGAGTTILTADNTYTGGTTITDGALQLGNGGTSGGIVGDVVDNGSLAIDRSNDVTLDGVISGGGTVNQIGAGTTTLAGDNSYTGATNVDAGTLFVNGDQSAAAGQTSVASGATLGGSGIIGGDVVMTGASTLAAGNNDVGTLTINGDLTLASGTALNYEFGEADVAGGALNDLVNVGGDLRLDGTVNVTVPTGGDFGAGIYRMFNYGTLDDQGLTLGTMPSGSDVVVQTSVAGQVNLVNSAGLLLTLWDGDAGPKFDGNVDGGNGFWQYSAGNNNWTNTAGTINAGYADGGFAIFAGTAGTVAVDNSLGAVTASGMQFASDGYLVGGGDIALVGPQSTIRVGDGTAAGAAMTATIASRLTGATQLVKTDDGTLVLTGPNGYTGGTAINDGTLQLGDGSATGSIQGDVVNNGTLAFDRPDVVDFGGAITGTGAVNQIGTGTTILTADNSYTGETHIQTGAMELSGGGTIDGTSLTAVRDGGILTVTGGSSSLTTVALAIGDVSGNSATLNIEDGGTVGVTGTDAVIVGVEADGFVNVDGTGSSLTAAGTLQLGDSTTGTGILNVANGGRVANADGVIGGGGDGEALVTGADSAWENTGRLSIGIYGAGKLNIEDGATVTNADGLIGSSARGDVVVSGLGTTWANSGQLTVGSYGIGTLLIEDGAVVTSNQGYIGSGDISDGSVTVTGPGSDWTTTLNINIGNYGTGSLSIADGALVQAGDGVDLGFSAVSASGTLTLQGTPVARGTLETSQIRANLGTANVIIDGGIVRASEDNADFITGFGTQEITIAANGATIDTNGHDIAISAQFSATGGLSKVGAGTLTLSGTNSYAGATTVNDGTLLVNGDQSAALGLTSVAASAILGGIGTIGGDVTVAGGTINPGDLGVVPGTLTINGSLSLDGGSTLNYNFGQAGVVGGAFNDLMKVGGDLALDGTLNVQTTPGNSFDPGVYRVISYDGGLTDNSLTIGTIPSPDFYVQTSIPGQVNLVNTAGMTLRYWDGETVASKNSGTIEGGDGVWQNFAGNDNWTEQTGAANAPFTDAAFAVFTGAAGTVSIDNSLGAVNVSGMQFATGKYEIEGGAINLVGGSSIIRVGDGTNDGGSFTATIHSELAGTSQLVKTDLGTLVLTGDNSYTGGTAVNDGTLLVNGNQSAALGLTSVGSATLGGIGTIGGDVEVARGTIAPGSNGVGTLTVKGSMALDGGSTLAMEFGEADVEGGTLNDLINVDRDLVLDGTIDVTVPAGGSFDTGIYRVFNYGGKLTDNGLDIGTMPASSVTIVQTSVVGQVNLVNTAGLFLNFWDGTAGPKFDGVVNGGDGVWQSGSGNNNWTDGAGTFNAPYRDGGFAVFAGGPGTVTIDNSLGQVTASGMQFASNGYTIAGESLELVGAQATIRIGDGTSAGSAFIATIDSELSGASELVKTDLGTLVLTGNNTYTGGTAINGGTLQVAADTALGDAAGGLSFDGGTLHTTADMTSDRSVAFVGDGTVLIDTATTFTWNGPLSGVGSLAKDGAGTLLVTADSGGYRGGSHVKSGTLAVDGILGGNVDIATAGRLEGNGRVGGVTNAGVVAPGRSIGTLTIAGDYTGNGGSLEIETTLGDDSSPTDLLIVNGDTSGSTTIDVINRGGLGAQTQEGIRIIDVGGTSNGTFTLNGDYLFEGEQAVVAGAYGYRLYNGGVGTPADGDWYLRSTLLDPVDPGPLYQPGVPIYESYAGTLQQFNKLDTLQQRIGNRQWETRVQEDTKQGRVIDTSGIWARIEAAHAEISPEISTSSANYDANTWKFQAGIDNVLAENEAGRFVGGVFFQYGTVSSSVSSPYGVGGIDTTGYGFGATLTWYGENGFYADGQAQVTWYDSDLGSSTAGRTLTDGNNGVGYAFSIEAGQRLALGDNWSLTPQAQLSYSAVQFDDFTDAFGADVSLDHSRSLISRFGMAVNHDVEWRDARGHTNRAHLYGIANVYYDFAGESKIDVAGTSFSSRNDRLYGGVGLGGSLNWADDKYSLYGEAQLNTSLENFGDSNSIGGTVGFRVRW